MNKLFPIVLVLICFSFSEDCPENQISWFPSLELYGASIDQNEILILGDNNYAEIPSSIMEEWGTGNFNLSLSIRGINSEISADAVDYGVLFIRSNQAPEPYTGPTVFLYDNGEIRFRMQYADELICPNIVSSWDEWIDLSFVREGNELQIYVNNEIACNQSITDSYDDVHIINAPLRFGANHDIPVYQNINAEIKNLKITGFGFPIPSIDDENCLWEGCTDSSACNYDEIANTDDGSCEYCQATVSFGEIDYEQGTIDINIESDSSFGGFQFGLSGASINSVSGGLAESNGFTLSSSESLLLGFSMTGSTIPPGSGTLVQLQVEFEDSVVCLNDVFVSRSDGFAFEVEVGECQTCENFELDDCGLCFGDNSSCSGCTDQSADNYDSDATIDNGECLYTVNYSLHSGNNLVSFLALPEDSSVGNMLSSVVGNATNIIGEGEAATALPNGQWVGSLNEINLTSGYWIKMNVSSDISIVSNEPAGHPNLEYNLHSGSNLISFPLNGVYDVNDVFPQEVVWLINGIIGEGVAATNLNGQFVGSLSSFEGGKGYWINVSEPIILNFYQP